MITIGIRGYGGKRKSVEGAGTRTCQWCMGVILVAPRQTFPVPNNFSLHEMLWVLYHVLHADADLPVAVESTVESHDVGRIALVQDLKLSDDLVANGWLYLQVDQL